MDVDKEFREMLNILDNSLLHSTPSIASNPILDNTDSIENGKFVNETYENEKSVVHLHQSTQDLHDREHGEMVNRSDSSLLQSTQSTDWKIILENTDSIANSTIVIGTYEDEKTTVHLHQSISSPITPTNGVPPPYSRDSRLGNHPFRRI